MAVAVAVAVDVAAPGVGVAAPGVGVARPGVTVAVPGAGVVIPGVGDGVVGVVVGAAVTVAVPVPGVSFFAHAPKLKTKATAINSANNLFISLQYSSFKYKKCLVDFNHIISKITKFIQIFIKNKNGDYRFYFLSASINKKHYKVN